MQRLDRICILIAAMVMLGAGIAHAAPKRARDLGVPFEGTPGVLNAITDVPGVKVGQITLITGEGKTQVGVGPIRTGVTVVFPREKNLNMPVYSGFYNLNGNGEMTGQSYMQDFGVTYGPIGISNTNAVGDLYAGIQRWSSKQIGYSLWPVVAETYDGDMNDIEGFHVTPDVVTKALNAATAGSPVAEGNVGGGTGMTCFEFKGGTGTASRIIKVNGNNYTLGVLVQCNTGKREVLRIAGTPVGRELSDKWLPCYDPKVEGSNGKEPLCAADGTGGKSKPDSGSIIIVVATDAPLVPLQLNRIARRAAMGLGRLGSYSGNESGDLIIAFSTAKNVNDVNTKETAPFEQFPTGQIDTVFTATVEATEEAVVNAMVGASTMTGRDGYTNFGLPHEELKRILAQYNRLGR